MGLAGPGGLGRVGARAAPVGEAQRGGGGGCLAAGCAAWQTEPRNLCAEPTNGLCFRPATPLLLGWAPQVAGGHKLMAADSAADFKQVLRHLADSAHSVPLWRQQRPAVMVEAAEFHAAADNPSLGTLLLRCARAG